MQTGTKNNVKTNLRLIAATLLLFPPLQELKAEDFAWSVYMRNALYPSVTGAASPSSACSQYIRQSENNTYKLSFYDLKVWTRIDVGAGPEKGPAIAYLCGMRERMTLNGRDWGDSWYYVWIYRTGNGCSNNYSYDELRGKCRPANDESGPSSTEDTNSPKSCAGNPINIANGNKYQKEIDIKTTSKLELSRHYNSHEKTWQHNYSARLFLGAGAAMVKLESGRESVFNISTPSAITREAGQGQLVRLDNQWLFSTPATGSYYFSDSGQLVRRVDLQGDSYNLSYSEHETRVTDGRGNQISYTEDAQGQVLSAHGNGNAVKYAYDGPRLIEAFYERGGASQSRQYHYEDPLDPGLLTGITDERGIRYATWAYDDQGRAISSEHAGGAEKVTVAYNADGSSTVTNALGKRTTYRFQTIQGIRRITAIEGEPSANCPNSNSTFTYDDRGLVKTRTDNKGNVTTFDYNERGLEVSRTEAFGTPQARTVTTEWHPTLFLPVTITEPDRTTRYSYDIQGRLIGQTTTQR
ncbi:DUF6531 domain-containing protein [Pseudomonas sp. zfem005]|uniref:DUF6531 domain-containing protein n=1 Tax=Pseudomonas sp. zfem005 TaxID=3078200 RepID=UPI0029299668|nr:DUF6531 domain-containing protein [Pseudomonas sp. zfem005]MDU9416372.1 DUF6531 domain-containing protein [Pseudomonas sp. zfem005]